MRWFYLLTAPVGGERTGTVPPSGCCVLVGSRSHVRTAPYDHVAAIGYSGYVID